MQESSRAGWGRGSSRERTGCSEKGLPHLSVELLDDLLDVDHELPAENSWNGAKRVKHPAGGGVSGELEGCSLSS